MHYVYLNDYLVDAPGIDFIPFVDVDNRLIEFSNDEDFKEIHISTLDNIIPKGCYKGDYRFTTDSSLHVSGCKGWKYARIQVENDDEIIKYR